MKKSVLTTVLAAVFAFLAMTPAFAGSLDQAASPTSAGGGAMYTLENIYQRLLNGTAATKRVGPFAEPGSGPTVGTGHTLDEVMGLAPVLDNTDGATAGNVLTGKTFWGLTVAGWGLQTGTLACAATATGTAVDTDVLATKTFSNSLSNGITGAMPNNGAFGLSCGAANQSVTAGYYSGGTLAGDADLVAGNIRNGVDIFGVTGTFACGASATGDAVAADVLTGKTFSNGISSGIAGGMTDNGAVTITPGATAKPIAAGYHDGTGTVATDANLLAANIVSGKTIFGVTGTAITRTCTGTLSALGRWCDYGVAVGTVMDMTTGLVWLRNANCSALLAGINKTGALNWSDAVVWSSAVSSGVCGLSDSSVQGDWRLPTLSELKTLTTGTEKVLSGSPGSFTAVQAFSYWSATTVAGIPTAAWFVNLNVGFVVFEGKTITFYVLPVR